MNQIDIEKALKLAQELPLVCERLHRIGLYKTSQKMAAVMQEISYEVAEHLEAKQKNRNE